MGIPGRSLAISTAFVCCVLTLGGAGIWGMWSLENVIKRTSQASTALADQTLSDMMHDALRADVLSAHQFALEGPAAEHSKEITDDVKEHGDRFAELTADILKIDLPVDVREKVEARIPLISSYHEDARLTANAALEQPEIYATRAAPFQVHFKDMEGPMGAIGETLEAFQKQVASEAASIARLSQYTLYFSAAIALCIAFFSHYFSRRTVVAPLKVMAQNMKRLASGDLKIEITNLEGHDEIGAMARALEVFKSNALETESLAVKQRENATRARGDREAARHRMADDFEAQVGIIVTSVAKSSVEVENFATSMTNAAEATAMESNAVASSLDAATANVQSAASAGEELAASIQEISRQVTRSAELATATVEDARAGEAGKGFAAVASEVKSLANQTAHATAEISKQIASSQTVTQSAIVAIQKIGERIAEMNEIATAIRAAMSQQESATREIPQSMSQAAAGTSQVNHALVNDFRVADETGAVASQLSASSVTLSTQSTNLRLPVDKFVHSVRTAG